MSSRKASNEIRECPYTEIDTNRLIELYEDRTEFKLWSAQQHLDKLKEIESFYGGIMGKYRIYAESELDCYFSQIIGARDSLLILVNNKLRLGINEKNVDLHSINGKLKERGEQHILKDLNDARWLKDLNELRNRSTHRGLLTKQFTVNIVEDVSQGTSSSIVKNYFHKPPDYEKPMDEEIISYLETSIKNTRNLIDKIKQCLV